VIAMQNDRERRLKEIGSRLRDFRKQLGYKSQETFASELGMKRPAYSHYELGESEPTGAFLHSLSVKFGADINYILTGKNEQKMPDLDTYLTRMGVDDMMRSIIKGYMALPEPKRKIAKEFIENLAAEIVAKKNAADAPAAPVSELDTPPTADRPYDELSIDEKVERFRAALESEEKAKEKSSATFAFASK